MQIKWGCFLDWWCANFLTGWSALILAIAIGVGSVAYTHGYILQPAYKQVVIKEVGKGHYTISEGIVDDPASVTKVAHTPREVQAIVWAYLSGSPVKSDWKE